MFERYTQRARRAIFFARAEASEFGSPYIETEHLLLGLLWEDAALRDRLIDAGASPPSVRSEIESRLERRERTPANMGLPLSAACKRVLGGAVEEADRMGQAEVGTEHLLLGILRQEKSSAATILRSHGLELSSLRDAPK